MNRIYRYTGLTFEGCKAIFWDWIIKDRYTPEGINDKINSLRAKYGFTDRTDNAH